jgi:hypothetical protein
MQIHQGIQHFLNFLFHLGFNHKKSPKPIWNGTLRLLCDPKGRKIKLLWGFKYANQLGVYQPKNVGKEKVNDTKSSI